MSTSRTIALLPTLLAALAVIGCAREDTSTSVATTEAPPPAPVAPAVPPPPPAPDPQEQVAASLSEVGATESERGYTLRFSSAEFAPGKSDFTPTDPMRIERVVSVLEAHPDMHARIEGHTDSRGSEQVNEKLSKERGEAVKQALIARGIDESRIDVKGLGESEPIADNDTAEGREQNRRVEIVFSNLEGRFASAGESRPRG